MMTALRAALLFAAMTVLSCARAPDTDHAVRPDYDTPVVLFVSPDSQELSDLQERHGEDFFVVADDAMWYRALALELVDSLELAHADTEADSARFIVNGQTEQVTWIERGPGWFAVVYDGRNRPSIVADVDIRRVLVPAAGRDSLGGP